MSTNFNMAVSGMGLGRDTPWAKAAIYMFGLWTIATSFVCFEKPDFLNVSFITILNQFCVADYWNHGSFLVLGPLASEIIISSSSSFHNAFVLNL